MIKLSARQFEILNKLIEGESLNIEKICNRYDVSRRTVYREINAINKAIGSYGIAILNSSERLTLEGETNNLKKLRMDLLGVQLDFDADKRRTLILSELLQLKEPIKLEYFAKKFGVSVAAVSYDLKELEKWFEAHNLLLVTKPGFGVSVTGDESDFRKAITDFLYENIDTESLVEFLNKASPERTKNDLSFNSHFLDVIDQKTVVAIEKSVAMLSNELDFYIAESSYMGLIIHLALAIKRLESGESIEIETDKLNELRDTEEYAYAMALAGYLEDELKIKIPEGEIGYITVHLRGARYRANVDTGNRSELNDLADSLISEAEKIFGTSFKDDELLRSGLLTHLEPALYRLSTGLAIRNPLLEDIKTKYMDLYEKTKKVCEVLKSESGIPIPDDEIGYIAMHFGAAIERKERNTRKYNVLVVCASGIGTSRMLLSKLQLFPQINVVDAVSSLKLKEGIENEDIDLIISTIPVNNMNIKSVVVNPLLLSEDIEKIKNALNTDLIMNRSVHEYKTKKDYDIMHIARYGRHMLNMLDSIDITELNSTTSEELIDELLSCLSRRSLITSKDAIKERLLNRESLGKIILPGRGFVIYHCTIDSLKYPLVMVGRITGKVTMKNLLNENETIKTAFLMLAPEEDREGIEVMGDISVSLIEDNLLIDKINAAEDNKQLRNVIEEAIRGKFLDEIKRMVM
ncbi:BglG family transcription antiterminator [Calorimonas adulescens]|uniref:BglG family transcription antiterminator n=1 Tax=Calorimonas adulescens TaxID=2606906 RepID=A0A5D8QI40_9THEO|nr:BglG family transcription antiterminator [Calorimonas adulescens]TZE83223.1 BglG family transcription antiterminator [Calorimonas adulescens]